MRILFSDNLLLLGAGILSAWFLVRFLLIPYARRALSTAKGGHLVAAGGRFGFLLTLQLLLNAMLLAAIIVATCGYLLQLYIASFANTTESFG